MQKIVTIGGGTGHYQILRGLKKYLKNKSGLNEDLSDLSAIVNICDDGGHSGKLRDERGILPPGDLRQCLIALADDENNVREIFEYRNKKGESLGNEIIAFYEERYGRARAIKQASKLLNVKGEVLPVSLNDFNICARQENGNILRGQKNVSNPASDSRIIEVYTEEQPSIYTEAEQKLRDATKIVICSGDLYGSIIPNSLVKGLKEAINFNDNAKVIYVCNAVTKAGTYKYKASDFVREIERYFSRRLDAIVLNTKIPSQETLRKYLDEKSEIVEDDLEDDKRLVRAEIISEYPSEYKTIIRHEPDAIAKILYKL